ncbi:MAG: tetratricopeptide repeat protein, partial [Candidatus Woesebacteria bacterium]|nr:tetratricopeptide repeat protein [Candidatus Woesebacteria bacterium]
IISCLFYFLVNQFDKRTKNLILVSLFASGIFLSISILFTQLGLFAKIPQLPVFMKNSSFSPVGGNLPSVLYLATLLPIGIALIIKERELTKRIFWAVASAVIVFGVTILVIGLLPGKPQALVLPGLRTSWEIVIETLKASPIWGTGPDNYVSAFNAFRSIAYNQTGLWLARFSTANNYYFTLITELGFAGLAAIAVLIIGIYRVIKSDLKQKQWEVLSIALLVVLFAILPSASVLLFLLMALLSVFSHSEEKSVSLAAGKVPSAIIAAPIILGVAALGIFGTKAVGAELTYQKSLVALTNNDAKNTYDLMTKAITQNPYVDRYHATLAQIDMAIATSIANNKNLTDTDRTNITTLISQAINEGKATVTLNSGRSGNWELLAQIYGSIMPFAQGADQFAIQTYTQAVALDPLNPNLRVALGGIYYSLGRYDDAIDAFKLAVLTKPDLANAHYNLAIAYREKKNYDNAISEMNTVLTLVIKDSPDYTLAKNTLDALEKNKAAAAPAAAAENLTTPQTQVPIIKPPLTLPQEATPPAANQ